MTITDDNKTIVSKNIADAIEEDAIAPDNKKEWTPAGLEILDVKQLNQ